MVQPTEPSNKFGTVILGHTIDHEIHQSKPQIGCLDFQWSLDLMAHCHFHMFIGTFESRFSLFPGADHLHCHRKSSIWCETCGSIVTEQCCKMTGNLPEIDIVLRIPMPFHSGRPLLFSGSELKMLSFFMIMLAQWYFNPFVPNQILFHWILR